MKTIVIGAGRMGLRHCKGVLRVKGVTELIVVDINETALQNTEKELTALNLGPKISHVLWDDFLKDNTKADVIIVASTAGNRKQTSEAILKAEPKFVLIEKPLGQSYKDVLELVEFFKDHKHIKAFVNLNTRLYPAYQKLKNDLASLPQFDGVLNISINTGTVGIGANGIHFIDLVKYLTDTDSIKLVAAEIDDTVIPNGRGPQFADFGGFAVLDYYDRAGVKKARTHFILGSQSTVFGPWEFVGPHGHILVNEFEQARFNKYRKEDSTLPVNRYAGDYLPQEKEVFEVPFLDVLTEKWLSELLKGNHILPELEETLVVHDALFNWLSFSNQYKETFPIT